MPKIRIDDIFPGSVLKEGLYHIDSGVILLEKGEVFHDEFLDIFEQNHIEEVFQGVSPFEVEEFLFDVNHKPISINTSLVGNSFLTPLYDRKKRVLIEPNTPINESFVKLISKSGGVVYQQKAPQELNSNIARMLIERIKKVPEGASKTNEFVEQKFTTDSPQIPIKIEKNIQTITKANIQQKEYAFDQKVDLIANGININADFVDQDLIKRKKPHKVEVVPDAVLLEMGVKDPLVKRTEAYKNTFLETYTGLLIDVHNLFNDITKSDGSKIDTRVKATCSRIVNTLIADKNLVINLTNMRRDENDYLAQHSLNVAIFSVNIGCAIGFSEAQIFELAFGALLADLGMKRVNQDILEQKKSLVGEDRRYVEKHPAFSLDFLNQIKGIPSSVPYIIYQSHEKLDGSGYPKSRPSFLIHEFAKIIHIADAFDALCSDRPWRKALSPYKAMEEIIKLASQKKLDGKIIRQWLFSISLFPVGSYVHLNDASIAKVISANPSDFTRPNLRIITKNGQPLTEKPTLMLNANKELKIIKAMPNTELQFQAMEGF